MIFGKFLNNSFQQVPVLHEPPRRVLIKLPESEVTISDFLFPGESTEASAKAVEEMFGFVPELEDLDDEQELVASPKQVVVRFFCWKICGLNWHFTNKQKKFRLPPLFVTILSPSCINYLWTIVVDLYLKLCLSFCFQSGDGDDKMDPTTSLKQTLKGATPSSSARFSILSVILSLIVAGMGIAFSYYFSLG